MSIDMWLDIAGPIRETKRNGKTEITEQTGSGRANRSRWEISMNRFTILAGTLVVDDMNMQGLELDSNSGSTGYGDEGFFREISEPVPTRSSRRKSDSVDLNVAWLRRLKRLRNRTEFLFISKAKSE